MFGRFGYRMLLLVGISTTAALAGASFDFDADGDTDLTDFGQFQLCFTGPGGTAGAGCNVGDADGDGDIDLVDFAAFQTAFTGPGGCAAGWSEEFGGDAFNGGVQALVPFDDGTGTALYAGGFFTMSEGMFALNVARWDGTSWGPLPDGFGVGSGVHVMESFDDGTGASLYVGGVFTTGGGMLANRIIGWDADGAFTLGSGLDGAAHAMAVFDDGTGPALYVGGLFTSAGGITSRGIARWDGTNWSTVGGSMNGAVFALEVFDDGTGPKLYASGGFTSAASVPANHIARWDGSSWEDVSGGLNIGNIQSFAAFDDGTGLALYGGGLASFTDGSEPSMVIRWDGSEWSAVGTTPLSGVLFKLGVFNDGTGETLYAGGDIFDIGMAFGESVSVNIMRWDGLDWTPVDGGTNSTVFSMEVFDDGSGPGLFVGGSFQAAGEVPSGHIAKWSRPAPPCGG